MLDGLPCKSRSKSVKESYVEGYGSRRLSCDMTEFDEKTIGSVKNSPRSVMGVVNKSSLLMTNNDNIHTNNNGNNSLNDTNNSNRNGINNNIKSNNNSNSNNQNTNNNNNNNNGKNANIYIDGWTNESTTGTNTNTGEYNPFAAVEYRSPVPWRNPPSLTPRGMEKNTCFFLLIISCFCCIVCCILFYFQCILFYFYHCNCE